MAASLTIVADTPRNMSVFLLCARHHAIAQPICQIFTIAGENCVIRQQPVRTMLKHIRTFLLACALAGPLVPAASLAADGEPISVKVNMARILRINAPAATVIIGNPGVADVTIQDPQTLVLTGRSYGRTNLIVLDQIGNPIADTLVEVIQAQADTITVFQGGARTTVACAPDCAPTVMLGDDPGFTSTAISSSSLVRSLAE